MVCIGTGPSLTVEDVNACRGQHVIAIKDAIQLVPWADVLYCGEDRWWSHHGTSLTFSGLRYTLHHACGQWAQVLRFGAYDGLCESPDSLASGHHSGYQAVNLAVHLGAKTIVLLGYDMGARADGRTHWFGEHPYQRRKAGCSLGERVDVFLSMLEPLKRLGVRVLNASRETALTMFPRVSLAEALA